MRCLKYQTQCYMFMSNTRYPELLRKQGLIKEEREANARLMVPLKWEQKRLWWKTGKPQKGSRTSGLEHTEGAWLFLLWDLKLFRTSLLLDKARWPVYIFCLDSHLVAYGHSVNTVSGSLHDLHSDHRITPIWKGTVTESLQ